MSIPPTDRDPVDSENADQAHDSRSPWCSECHDYTRGHVSVLSEGMRQFYGATTYKCDECRKPMWTASGCRVSMRRCRIFSIAGIAGIIISGLGLRYSGPHVAAIAVTAWNLLVINFLFVRPCWMRKRHLRRFQEWSAKAALYGNNV